MKLCISCGASFYSKNWKCPKCSYEPPMENGFYSFAPDFSKDYEGFESDYFAEFASTENTSFWFQARNRLIAWALKDFCKDFENFLEIGCGTGVVLEHIEKNFPNVQLTGSEIFSVGLEFASSRITEASFVQLDARCLPYKENFDVIGIFDVLEHIHEDSLVLKQIHQSLKPGGKVLIAVPQHPWLWSYHDELVKHVRRYTTKELRDKVCCEGFDVIYETSFVSLLLPLMYLSRIRTRKNIGDEKNKFPELRVSKIMNSLLTLPMIVELSLIKFGIRFPWGGSRFLVAVKA